jgi:arsenical-resistance protein 2
MVRTAINTPAQSFYPTRLTWLEILGRVPYVIFYCSSSHGRELRCAGWYQDMLDEFENKTSESIVLAGGINLWAEKQKNLTDNVLCFPGYTIQIPKYGTNY